MSIISLSGKIGTGKDTVTKIIQILTSSPHFTNEAVIKFLDRDLYNPKWKNKKFANKLKDIVCILINCTREQLEDREFKEKELGPEWNAIKYHIIDSDDNFLFSTFYKDDLETEFDYYSDYHHRTVEIIETEIILTPRLLLQLLGTEAGRNIIHPNIWVNSLMNEYSLIPAKFKDLKNGENILTKEWKYPNWIISDTRFPNELEAVKERKGLLIKIERDYALKGTESDPNKLHYSETALDYFKSWDYIIFNNGDFNNLIDQVRVIIEKSNIK